MIKVIDDFISEEDSNRIEEVMLSSYFPWFISINLPSEVNSKQDYDFYDPKSSEIKHQFMHLFYKNYSSNSQYFEILTPILQKINPSALIRIKSILHWKTEKTLLTGYHKDTLTDNITAIYYVNSNDGVTMFEDGTKVESVKNRFVMFDSNLKHTGTTCTDSELRCAINFNYYQSK